MSESADHMTGDPARRGRRAGIYLGLLGVTSLLILLSLNVAPLTDPDEVFYAQTAREMLEKGSPLTPLLFGHPQFEKPPLTYWLLEGSFAVFGLQPFAGRLIPALAGILGAWLAFLFARRVASAELAALGGLVMLSGLFYLGMSIVLLTDMVFTTLIAAGAYAFYLWWAERRGGFLWAFGALMGLAVLTKGPAAVAVLLLATVAFLLVVGSRDRVLTFLLHPWWLAFAAVAVPWYAWAWLVHGRAFWWEFLVHDNWHRILRAEHRSFDTWYFYPAVMVAGMLPWSPWFPLLGANWKKHRPLQLFLLCWIVATYVIFAMCHSKLASYILPLYPALSLWLAISLEAPEEHPRRRAAAAILLAVLGAAMVVAPFVVKVGLQALPPTGIWAIAACGVVQLMSALLLARRQVSGALAATAGGFLASAFVLLASLSPAVAAGITDADIPKVVAERGLAGEPIIASKLFARGVHFHAGNPVVVYDRRKQPFWSDHPLDVISSDEEVSAHFAAHDKVLCVVHPGDLDRIKGALGSGYTATVLSNAFDRTVALITRAR
jgi:4-amino-4-deoxy-L-arabinose transferase-like glycosyltransferase